MTPPWDEESIVIVMSETGYRNVGTVTAAPRQQNKHSEGRLADSIEKVRGVINTELKYNESSKRKRSWLCACALIVLQEYLRVIMEQE